jgi:hypothetical protein
MVFSLTKFVWNFAVCCKKDEDTEEMIPTAWGETHLTYKVVLNLVANI